MLYSVTLVVTDVVNTRARNSKIERDYRTENKKPSYAPIVGKNNVLGQKQPVLLYELPIISKGYRNGQ
jgi:hypothetical protein